VYGLVGYVNFVGLLPTAAAIAAAPEHFFRRVPANGRSFNSLYKPPLKFLTSFAALVGALAVTIGPRHFNAADLRIMVVLTALAMPVLMLALVLFVWVLYSWGVVPVWFKRLWAAANLVDARVMQVLFSWRTYRLLNWKRYYWTGFYFYCYAYIALAGAVAAALLAGYTYVNIAVGVLAFILAANRWIVYRYYILLCCVLESKSVESSATCPPVRRQTQ
jgi:hypothetical protein